MADRREPAAAMRDEINRRYRAVAHLLAEPERRQMRRYIAQMTALVREARTAHTPAIQLAIARASTAAADIADAVLRRP